MSMDHLFWQRVQEEWRRALEKRAYANDDRRGLTSALCHASDVDSSSVPIHHGFA